MTLVNAINLASAATSILRWEFQTWMKLGREGQVRFDSWDGSCFFSLFLVSKVLVVWDLVFWVSRGRGVLTWLHVGMLD